MTEFDYVIVGAGSAGCVLAARLSENPNTTVCLLEAGPSDAHAYVRMPRGVGKLMSMPAYMYFYMTVPEPHTGMRPDFWLRGKVVGGSSSVNGMVWVRGQPADYDRLAELTSNDWCWTQFADAFEAIEHHQLGQGPARGGGGPLRISLPSLRNDLTRAILSAGKGMGWPVKGDVNAPDAGDGIGFMPCTIWQGKRQSATVAFLDPARSRPNLTVLTGALADRVVLDGKRASAVEVMIGGERLTMAARREVIISAGAVASPGLLERSGIGRPDLLADLGIPVLHALPGVGENTSEHRALRMQWRLKRPLSYNREYGGARLIWNVMRYYLTRGGPMSVAAIDMRAVFRSRSDLDRADIQAQIGLYSWDLASGGALERDHGFCAVVNPITPASQGSVHINSRDPQALPTIIANYGAISADRVATAAAVRVLRCFARQAPLRDLIEVETTPGPGATSDDDILAAMDAHGCAGMHTVGSCRMGKDAKSVVDPELKLRGIEGLRIADASVFPFIPAGNTNAPVIALAWRAADIIQRHWDSGG